MEPLTEMLALGERVLEARRFSLWSVSGNLFKDLLGVGVSCGLMWFEQSRPFGYGALALTIIMAAWGMAKFFNNRIWVTDRRLIAQTGWPGRDVLDFPFERFESANVHQSLAGRMLGFGDIRIAGVGSTVATLACIGSPLAFKKMLDMAKAYGSATANPARDAAFFDTLDMAPGKPRKMSNLPKAIHQGSKPPRISGHQSKSET